MACASGFMANAVGFPNQRQRTSENNGMLLTESSILWPLPYGGCEHRFGILPANPVMSKWTSEHRQTVASLNAKCRNRGAMRVEKLPKNIEPSQNAELRIYANLPPTIAIDQDTRTPHDGSMRCTHGPCAAWPGSSHTSLRTAAKTMAGWLVLFTGSGKAHMVVPNLVAIKRRSKGLSI